MAAIIDLLTTKEKTQPLECSSAKSVISDPRERSGPETAAILDPRTRAFQQPAAGLNAKFERAEISVTVVRLAAVPTRKTPQTGRTKKAVSG
ncbi:MAG TPA: hypothetical protein VF911_08020 [Thermoanaerobaculia bacterium]